MQHNTPVNPSIRLLTIALSLLLALPISGQVKWNAAFQTYVDTYKDMAVDQMYRYGIPASITLAQGLLESGGGTSRLATYGNNHFGIKCHDWTGASMQIHDDKPDECFRVYGNARESFEDHSLFLKRSRYNKLFTLPRTDYKGWAKGLKECGYATNPVYAQTLIDIIETYKLYAFDTVQPNETGKYRLGGRGERKVLRYNKNYYVLARSGDTFRVLGNDLDISFRSLAKYNEHDTQDVLEDGDVVYLMKKQKHAAKEYKNHVHVVAPGESMHSIAQLYGIRLKSLYKINKLSRDYTVRVGDQLKVY